MIIPEENMTTEQEWEDRMASRRRAHSDAEDEYGGDLKRRQDSDPEDLIEMCLGIWEENDAEVPDPEAYRKAFLEDWKAMNPVGEVFVIIPLTDRGEPEYECGIQAGKYTRNEFVGLLRTHKDNPQVVQLLADMMEE